MTGTSRAILVGCVFALALTAPSGAGAQQVPSDSAFDQYLEGSPGRGGEEATILREERAPLPSDSRRELEGLGPVGTEAADLAETVGQPPRRGGEAAAIDRETGGGGIIESVLDPVPGGLGWLLPLILAVMALVTIAFSIARRRAEARSASA